ncbi:hypothetical protein Tco_0640604 [Tanacetum coccineum]
MVRCVYNLVDDLGHTASIYTSWASLDDKRIVVLVCPFVATCYCGLDLWHEALEVCCRGLLWMVAIEVCGLRGLAPMSAPEYVDTTSFSFGDSELVRGASSSNGCSIYLESLPYQRLFHHSLVEIVPLSFPLFFFGRSYLYYLASLLPLVLSFAATVHPG